MFIETLKTNARRKRIKRDKRIYKYIRIMKLKMLTSSLNGKLSCCMWLPTWIDIDEFNEIIAEDGIDVIVLYHNSCNNKQRVFVSEKIDMDDFWLMVKRNMKYNKK